MSLHYSWLHTHWSPSVFSKWLWISQKCWAILVWCCRWGGDRRMCRALLSISSADGQSIIKLFFAFIWEHKSVCTPSQLPAHKWISSPANFQRLGLSPSVLIFNLRLHYLLVAFHNISSLLTFWHLLTVIRRLWGTDKPNKGSFSVPNKLQIFYILRSSTNSMPKISFFFLDSVPINL